MPFPPATPGILPGTAGTGTRLEAAMIAHIPTLDDLGAETQAFYRQVVRLLNAEDVPFLVGGAYALAEYTGIVRHTKDFDLFTRPDDAPRVLAVLRDAGYRTETTFSHWLGKAFHPAGDFVDVIFSSGNGIAKVDDVWFERAADATFLGEPIRVCPVEEIIWSKGYICERERFDGADINHLLRARGAGLDWRRLLDRFGPHWRVLLSHLVLFGFVYPSDRHQVPTWVMDELLARLERDAHEPAPRRPVCQGTLLSRTQYVMDVERWDYEDARRDAESGMSADQAWVWTEAGLREQHE
jgi:hypothetical protein